MNKFGLFIATVLLLFLGIHAIRQWHASSRASVGTAKTLASDTLTPSSGGDDKTIKNDTLGDRMYVAKNFTHLLGIPGLSNQLLENHFKLYQGYVDNTNKLLELTKNMLEHGEAAKPEFCELKRRLGWEFNGMRLHELYFENLSIVPHALSQDSALMRKIEQDYGTFSAMDREVRAMAKIRGIGWIVLYYDSIAQKLMNMWIGEHNEGHPAGCTPLLVIDLWEHAYMTDYGIKRDGYMDVIMRSIAWDVVEKRFEKTSK
ncbi:MAG: Superoxide dismutase, Fe-Mn family [candidate division TM6 bacterium GW2011_GWE2_41_16]|nr:MAG: Superoxide dismutase, Fe-Mn family [candidate division TM6 bacterium GW2011_GWE2_41_16]